MRSTKSRPYTMRRRAELVDQTRQRIIEATVRLHTTIGPANTSIASVAEEADVTRLTVYRHFGDLDVLFEACRGHWRAQNPPPDASAWLAIPDLEARARAGARWPLRLVSRACRRAVADLSGLDGHAPVRPGDDGRRESIAWRRPGRRLCRSGLRRARTTGGGPTPGRIRNVAIAGRRARSRRSRGRGRRSPIPRRGRGAPVGLLRGRPRFVASSSSRGRARHQPARSSIWSGPGGPPSRASPGTPVGGRDVLVEPEQVGRVVASLDRAPAGPRSTRGRHRGPAPRPRRPGS